MYHLDKSLSQKKKLRISSVLKNKLIGCLKTIKDEFSEDVNDNFLDPSKYENLQLDENDFDLEDEKPIIVYVAGYCLHIALKKLNWCPLCKDLMSLDRSMEDVDPSFSVIANVDRGGLKYPSEAIIDLVTYNYCVVKKLTSGYFWNIFKEEQRQRMMAIKITNSILDDHEFSYWPDCDNGHAAIDICNRILYSATNCLLNNFCKMKNDTNTKHKNVRKMLTFHD
ncbi:hypothetical protein HELRODRAFT_177465 [Helobdella robusta]|uniref:Uncharacterized protein n=1 Tax=Helobdella robusta TaxID=6412 RepID=T1FBQ7_HELRO|nr:hypothetical protein HELRODRAFT_177465 [Helobdella robusta]ESN97829.1 hypothetical protein HELRODRAFT_177465 [Helobdella robusta]